MVANGGMQGKELGLVRDYMRAENFGHHASRPVRCDESSMGTDIKDPGDLRQLGPRIHRAVKRSTAKKKKLQYWDISVMTGTRLEGFGESKVRKDNVWFYRVYQR